MSKNISLNRTLGGTKVAKVQPHKLSSGEDPLIGVGLGKKKPEVNLFKISKFVDRYHKANHKKLPQLD
jgi:hypothetical protein